jgi:hypothetical protein
MDGQTERKKQILEDILRACWDKNLPWVEFSYNNNYQVNLKMAPFKVLYGRRCHTPLNWIKPGEKVIFHPDIVEKDQATVCSIQDNLRATKSRRELYK